MQLAVEFYFLNLIFNDKLFDYLKISNNIKKIKFSIVLRRLIF